MSQNIAYARQKGITNVNLESDVNYDSDQLASKVAATTGKQVFNNTQESKIEAMEHKNELYFKDFWETNFNIICGAVGIPPEVALGRYENNFSSSRMAGKAWEYAMKIDRYKFSHVFYKPYYNVWLELEILTNKIQAPGYLTAMVDNNYMALESYKNCTFIGASIPHVDPVKEVVAQRLLLADQTTPLTTHNKACESLNTGDFEENATRNIAEILFYNEESGNEDKDIEKVEDKNND